MAETHSNMEAVRGGFAYVRQALRSTRNYHAVGDKKRRRYYLCGCGRPALAFLVTHSTLARNRRKDRRWADEAQYRMRHPAPKGES